MGESAYWVVLVAVVVAELSGMMEGDWQGLMMTPVGDST
jgi:hypothetical protein